MTEFKTIYVRNDDGTAFNIRRDKCFEAYDGLSAHFVDIDTLVRCGDKWNGDTPATFTPAEIET